MFKLIGTDGTRYYSWDLVPGKHTLGRKPDCDFYVPDKTISRLHAEIDVDSSLSEATLKDLNSRNGTAVNSRKVTGPIKIKIGDTISFGQVDFRLSAEDGPVVEPSTKATRFASIDPEKSVFIDIGEALKPLPSRITDLPELFPALSDLARSLSTHETKVEMLDHSLKLVAKVIPADRFAVLMMNESTNELFAAATLHEGTRNQGEFTLSQTIVNDILKEKQAVVVGDPSTDSRYAEQKSIVASSLRSAMAVPLFDEGKVLGILYADTKNPLHHYNDEYLRLLATFGNIIASRLLSFALAEERQERKLIESELKRASLIQKRLLVGECPTVEKYSFHAFQDQCRAVGGDFYDMIKLPDGRYLFMVGDVSGKGLGAALLMSNILAAFRILYGNADFDLAQVVNQVNRQLFAYSNSGDFATLFVGTIDTSTHRLSFVNAGHNPPLLISANKSVKQLEPSGFMIGAFETGGWVEETVELSPDDLVAIYTDGVTEAEGPTEQYGDERLEKMLVRECGASTDEIGSALIGEITEFVQDHPQSDDITMLLLKRLD